MNEQGWVFGYIRVSSADQNEARQLEAMADIDPRNIYIDHASGKDRNRPQLQQLLRTVRRGDTVRVKSPDRLARNTVDLLQIAHELNEQEVSLEFIDAPMLNVSSAQGEFMLAVYGAFAQMERAMILDRQAEGIAIAKRQGKYKRKPLLSAQQIKDARDRIDLGVPKAAVARELGVSRVTLYNALDGKGIYGADGTVT